MVYIGSCTINIIQGQLSRRLETSSSRSKTREEMKLRKGVIGPAADALHPREIGRRGWGQLSCAKELGSLIHRYALACVVVPALLSHIPCRCIGDTIERGFWSFAWAFIPCDYRHHDGAVIETLERNFASQNLSSRQYTRQGNDFARTTERRTSKMVIANA